MFLFKPAIFHSVAKADLTDTPEGSLNVEYKALHDVADRMRPRVRRSFLQAIAQVKNRADVAEMERLISAGLVEQALRLVDVLLDQTLSTAGFKVEIIETVTRAAQAAREFMPKELQAQLQFDLLNPHSVEFINAEAAQLVVEVSNNTKMGLREIVRTGFEEGRAPAVMARTIRERVGLTIRQTRAVTNFRNRLIADGVKGKRLDQRVNAYYNRQLRWRATNIARTETINAANAGQEALWRQAADENLIDAAATRKFWLTTPDDRTCPICKPIPDMNKAGVPLRGSFSTPAGSRKRPTAHPQCRCAMRIREVE